MKEVKLTLDGDVHITNCICPFYTQGKFTTGRVSVGLVHEVGVYFCCELCPHFEHKPNYKYDERQNKIDISTVVITCSGSPVVLQVKP